MIHLVICDGLSSGCQVGLKVSSFHGFKKKRQALDVQTLCDGFVKCKWMCNYPHHGHFRHKPLMCNAIGWIPLTMPLDNVTCANAM